jgi:hypothetical protein
VAVNQTGPFLGMRTVVPRMRRTGGGSLINVSSIWGMMSWRGRTWSSSAWTRKPVCVVGRRDQLQDHLMACQRARYPLGVKVRDEELAAVPLVRHASHGEWNDTIQPAQPAAEKPPPTTR